MAEFFDPDDVRYEQGIREECHVTQIDDIFNDKYDEHYLLEKYTSNIKFFKFCGDQIFLVMKHPASLYFTGVISATTLAGPVEVNGFCMDPEKRKQCKIFSLSVQSALCFRTLNVELDLIRDLEPVFRLSGGAALRKALRNLGEISCVLLISRQELPLVKSIEQVFNISLLTERRKCKGLIHFNEAESITNCIYDVPSGNRIKEKLKFNQNFVQFAQEIQWYKGLRLVFCGGQGVGKSTSLRYLVNKLLSVGQHVLVIDFDIGQPEFTVPGAVSLVVVKKPLLGPSYTHSKKPLKSVFLGHVDPVAVVDEFEKAIGELETYCKDHIELSELPWLINTMGYIKGLGLVLLQDIVRKFNVSHVCQLHSVSNKSERGNESDDLLRNLPSGKFIFKSFRTLSKTSRSHLAPKMFRNLMTAFYLFRKAERLSLKRIQISNLPSFSSDRECIVRTRLLNGCRKPLVGEILAVCDPQNSNCIGFAQVISMENDYFDLMTPLTVTELTDSHFYSADLKLTNTAFFKIYQQLKGDEETSQGDQDGIKTNARKTRVITLIGIKDVNVPSLFSC